MKELIVTAYCDMCWQVSETKTPSVRMLKVSITGGVRPAVVKELEWCAEHEPAALAMMAIYEQAAANGETAPAPAAVKAEANRSPSEFPAECPICHKHYSATNTTISHIMQVHRSGEVLYPAGLVCEVCGQECASAQGYASHLRSHGVDLLARAAEPVLARARLKRERSA